MSDMKDFVNQVFSQNTTSAISPSKTQLKSIIKAQKISSINSKMQMLFDICVDIQNEIDELSDESIGE